MRKVDTLFSIDGCGKNEKELSQYFSLRSFGDTVAKEGRSNQDFFLADDDEGLYVVCDGMGGHDNGSYCSKKAVEIIGDNLKKIDCDNIEDLKNLMSGAIDIANGEIYSKLFNQNSRGGTTASVVKFLRGDKEENGCLNGCIANIGDSRVYLVTKNGVVSKITIDDSDYSQKQQGLMDNIQSEKDFSKSFDSNDWNNRNRIKQALGYKKDINNINFYRFKLAPGDRLLVTSDGIHDNLSNKEINSLISGKLFEGKNNNNIIGSLIAKSLYKSKNTENIRAKPDDITAILIENHFNCEGENHQSPRDDKAVQGSKKEGLPQDSEKRKNDNELESLVSGADDFDTLYDVIDHICKIKGKIVGVSGRSYTAEALVGIIKKVRAGDFELKEVTRAYGLRDKVGELISKENNKL